MNPLQRIQAVLEGKLPDRVPVCLHNFLLASKEAGVPMEQYRADPQAIARAHLDALARYGHDCILIDLDTTLLAEAMGAKAECAPGEPGRIVTPAIRSLDEVDRLKPANPETDGRIPALLESIRLIRKAAGKDVAIRGNCDQAAFDLACMVRGIEDFMMDLVSEPDNPAIERLLEVCYQTHLATHRAVKKAGADFTSLGDSIAGPDVVSPKLFERFARPYEERLIRELAAEGTFIVIHICGDTTKILNSLSQYPACGFELDYKTDARKAKETAGAKHALFGNIDPSGVIARGSAEDVMRKTRELISIWKPGGHFVLNAGCAIPATTPSENIRALVRAAHEFGRYE
ncbi:MAG: uroporphyrinogen decarboxylase family protein [Verrucomicrobia bacterium]|nr:uroporphyrinogen decarboxylase family protein [Verrucomicrobiota bacterium]